MVSLNNQSPSAAEPARTSGNLSYKFQRLRERLRDAVISGQLQGRLPGERILARQFGANPKTLSKALTDLAAEGLLVRSIGRGTYVKGSLGQTGGEGRWLILTDHPDTHAPLVGAIAALHSDVQVASAQETFRPSFVNQFSAVIDLGCAPASLHRDLIIRGIPSVTVGNEPTVYRTNSVVLDREHAAYALGRRLLMEGHTRLISVEKPADTVISTTLQLAAQRYAPEAAVESCTLDAIAALPDTNSAALICDGAETADAVSQLLHAPGAEATNTVLTAIGCAAQPPCRGYYVQPQAVAGAVADLLANAQPHRPAALWLLGAYVDQPAARLPLYAQPMSLTA